MNKTLEAELGGLSFLPTLSASCKHNGHCIILEEFLHLQNLKKQSLKKITFVPMV